MTSQRFCLRWNNHQTNLLSVFDQLLHDETFIDVTLAVDGQHLKAHKMVLSACSPYFQQLFVNHPDRHPIVILRDVPFKDMKCLLDFMYRGEVSVDQDRLAAFLRVAESLRIKGLTEVNDDKPTPPPPPPPSASSASSSAAISAPSAPQSTAGGAGGRAATTLSNAGVGNSGSGSAANASASNDLSLPTDDTMAVTTGSSTSLNSIPSAAATAANQAQTNSSTSNGHSGASTNTSTMAVAGQSAAQQQQNLKQLPPLLAATGIVTRSHSNSLLQQHHQPQSQQSSTNSNNSSSSTSSSNMLQTNPLLGSALSQQKRKRGRPRKLSGSDAGATGGTGGVGATGNATTGTGGGDGGDGSSSFLAADDYDSNSMDLMEVRIGSSGASISGDDEQQLRIVTSRSEMDDDIEADDRADEAMDDEEDEQGQQQQQRQQAGQDDNDQEQDVSIDEAMMMERRSSNLSSQQTNNNNHGAKRQRLSKNSSVTARKASLRNNDNSMSDALMLPKILEGTIVSIVATDDEIDEEDESMDLIAESVASNIEPQDADLSPNSAGKEEELYPRCFALLRELQEGNRLQELTIIDRGRGFYDERVVLDNGKELIKHEIPLSGLPSDDGEETIELLPLEYEIPACSGLLHPTVDHSTSPLDQHHGNDEQQNDSGVVSCAVQRRTRRKPYSSEDDPAEALTEMSVRGLDLFRYAAKQSNGQIQCNECLKKGEYKTFKNKYSFQRHAFLYHEGTQRKVFPCSLCDKTFSRPDKMKNHQRTAHGVPAINCNVETTSTQQGQFCGTPEVGAETSRNQKMHWPQQLIEQPRAGQSLLRQDCRSVPQTGIDNAIEIRRLKQEQDVLRIRSVVSNMSLRQLQDIQRQQDLYQQHMQHAAY
ncbi:protein tramtrack, alpha isoform isoform X2 [Anopheles aquasalis]|uniref:protein tramtrack, alpha isoform isoform X2 n=1 Tax=Anopheles aquasalis TaxID=42839 RepID=UPI00215AE62A|nr:protein tramtrack, alpha isoform isoform X2 [Anopheles aquasalis]